MTLSPTAPAVSPLQEYFLQLQSAKAPADEPAHQLAVETLHALALQLLRVASHAQADGNGKVSGICLIATGQIRRASADIAEPGASAAERISVLSHELWALDCEEEVSASGQDALNVAVTYLDDLVRIIAGAEQSPARRTHDDYDS